VVEGKSLSTEKIKKIAVLQEQITERQEKIVGRTKFVGEELAQAGPALAKAKEAVEGISVTEIREIKALARPPASIQMCMHVVLFMTHGKSLKWDEIRKEMAKKEFLDTVLHFDTDNLQSGVRKKCIELTHKEDWD